MFLFLNIFRTIPDLPNVTKFGRKINLYYKKQIHIFIHVYMYVRRYEFCMSLLIQNRLTSLPNLLISSVQVFFSPFANSNNVG